MTMDNATRNAISEAIEIIERASSVAGRVTVEFENGDCVRSEFHPVDWQKEAAKPKGLMAHFFGRGNGDTSGA